MNCKYDTQGNYTCKLVTKEQDTNNVIEKFSPKSANISSNTIGTNQTKPTNLQRTIVNSPNLHRSR
jgi:hypothetical protein